MGASARPHGAAICRYEGAGECYLFYLDDAVKVIEDWLYRDPAEAMEALGVI